MARKNPERHQQKGAVHEPPKQGYKDTKLVAKTIGQKRFIRTIVQNDVTICTGPPGTGKTHVACGLASTALKKGYVEKIILSRPVGTIESDIGYLPGGIRDKLGPYLVPLFDELNCYMSHQLIKQLMDTNILEIVPLSAMRGRTFRDSFVVLDEAQNATYADLKMFLTRFGQGSKVVASGDLKQTDLTGGDHDALAAVIDRVHHLDGVGISHLSHDDVVRHKLTSAFDKVL